MRTSVSKCLGMCLNWKVLLVLLAVGGGLFFFLSPAQAAAFLPFLLFALCPFSMLFMMATMHRGHNKAEKLFVCPECGLAYREPEWAKKCAAWCREHQSCNLEITAHAVEKQNAA